MDVGIESGSLNKRNTRDRKIWKAYFIQGFGTKEKKLILYIHNDFWPRINKHFYCEIDDEYFII